MVESSSRFSGRAAQGAVAVIINPISGGHRRGQAEARARLATEAVRQHGDEPRVFVTERAGHAHDLAHRAAYEGVRLVIAWGGDGTINEAASGLVFQDVPLAIIPAGSGNGLARELGVPHDPRRAIAAALKAEARPMDVGEIEGRYFVNLTGIGLDAHVAARFNAPDNLRRGLRGYVAIIGRALLHYVPQRYRITIDGRQVERTAILVSIANSPQFGNGARIAPAAKLDDGMLDLVTIEERSRWVTVRNLHRLFNSTVDRVPGCTIERGSRFIVEADGPMTFHVDGEPVEGGTRLRARVHPRALRICA
ncbi:MAG TPA: diacylglycerol kinase family protein [Vicinamibacterales bacterium]|nr:diacylglycerol kinase family protein [Vicinamibacterales bacterium]